LDRLRCVHHLLWARHARLSLFGGDFNHVIRLWVLRCDHLFVGLVDLTDSKERLIGLGQGERTLPPAQASARSIVPTVSGSRPCKDCEPGFAKFDAAVARTAATAPKRVDGSHLTAVIGTNIQSSGIKVPHLEIEMQQSGSSRKSKICRPLSQADRPSTMSGVKRTRAWERSELT
jgi:hypothetical protein